MKMVKCSPGFEYFYCILEKNFISKIRISKITDYAALKKRFLNGRVSLSRFCGVPRICVSLRVFTCLCVSLRVFVCLCVVWVSS